MKKIISLFLVLVMMLSVAAVSFVNGNALADDKGEYYILGDSDQTGVVDIVDATYIQIVLAGKKSEYEGSLYYLAGDIDKNKKVDIVDATLVQMVLAGIDAVIKYNIGEKIYVQDATGESTGEKAKLIVNCGDEKYVVNVGETFTYTYYLDVSEATKDYVYDGESSQGYISNVDARTDIDRNYVTPVYSSKTDLNKTFPIISKGALSANFFGEEDAIYFNASTTSWDFCFDNDGCILASMVFKAGKEGETDINTVITDMCAMTIGLDKIVKQSTVLSPFTSIQVIGAPKWVEPSESTQATGESETASETSQSEEKLTVNCDGKKYEVGVGSNFTYTYYLNVSEATKDYVYEGESSQGYISNVDASTRINREYVSPVFSAKTDVEKWWPILSNGAGLTYNMYLDDEIMFNASTTGWTLKFDSDDCVLVNMIFKAEKSGETDINTLIISMAGQQKDLPNIVRDYEVLYPFYSRQVISGTGVVPLETEETQSENSSSAEVSEPASQTQEQTDTEESSQLQSEGEKLTVVCDGKTYDFHVGDTLRYTYYLNVNEATKDFVYENESSQGYISNVEASVNLDRTNLKPLYSSKTDSSSTFPVISKGSLTVNMFGEETELLYNSSTTGWSFLFDDDGCILASIRFEVIAGGETELETLIRSMAGQQKDLPNIVKDYETLIPYKHSSTLIRI